MLRMEIEEFSESLKRGEVPPSQLSLPLQALWWSGKGNWARAHNLAQDAGSRDGDWVHAHLHRAEGDEGNAAYWYARSGKPFPEASLEEEWRAICAALLGTGG